MKVQNTLLFFVLTSIKKENTDFHLSVSFFLIYPSKTCIPTPNNPGPVWTTNAGEIRPK